MQVLVNVAHISKYYPEQPVIVHTRPVFMVISSHVTSTVTEYGNGNVKRTARSEFITTVLMKIEVFRDVTPC
jgi:hypothetical protein